MDVKIDADDILNVTVTKTFITLLNQVSQVGAAVTSQYIILGVSSGASSDISRRSLMRPKRSLRRSPVIFPGFRLSSS